MSELGQSDGGFCEAELLDSLRGRESGRNLLDDGDGIGGKRRWVLHVVVDDAVKHLLLVLAGEGRLESGQGDGEATHAA